jgi:beta-mannosidase
MCGDIIDLCDGWQVLQDVHELGEKLGIYRFTWDPFSIGAAISAWRPIPRLAHLHLLFARQPYFGRELRYFNEHPWWYRLKFDVPADFVDGATLRFDGVDYFAKVWLNEFLLGVHEGYATPFEFEVGPHLRTDRSNLLVVKVSSPWDREVPAGLEDKRTFAVVRNLIKGTYEHADTFIQRDVNPIGIWRPVSLSKHGPLRGAGKPAIDARPLPSGPAAASVTWPVVLDSEPVVATWSVSIHDDSDGQEVASRSHEIQLPAGRSTVSAALAIETPELWSTWDRSGPRLYRAELSLAIPGEEPVKASERFGIRTVELFRTEDETTFQLNGRPIFLRGTNYFPDVYLSAVEPARYRRDLERMIRAGINAVRVHVHTENPPFYELCDSLGLLVIQDFDLNWCFPTDADFRRRAVGVLEELIGQLRNHPSIACWVCQNEPAGRGSGPLHAVSPGPQLELAARWLDPERPVIRSSDVDDLSSGDSHNWSGALERDIPDYRSIRGTAEKLNTEFGFDAPPAEVNARHVPQMAERLATVLPRVHELHDYAYHLLKYFVEHYRRQKYRPCAGYFQFMWRDLSPQSFYGLYDWWGEPKAEGIGGGLAALAESNQPVAVLLDYESDPAQLWVVNDALEPLGMCTVDVSVADHAGARALAHSAAVVVGADALVDAGAIELPRGPGECARIGLTLRGPDGAVISRNTYREPLAPPAHPTGHPHRMDHELGMRLYWA